MVTLQILGGASILSQPLVLKIVFCWYFRENIATHQFLISITNWVSWILENVAFIKELNYGTDIRIKSIKFNGGSIHPDVCYSQPESWRGVLLCWGFCPDTQRLSSFPWIVGFLWEVLVVANIFCLMIAAKFHFPPDYREEYRQIFQPHCLILPDMHSQTGAVWPNHIQSAGSTHRGVETSQTWSRPPQLKI